MGYFAVIPTDNIKEIFGTLTSDKITEMSGGKIPKMTPEQASGLMGSWVVETGKPGLQGLDVVERGNNNAGRGLSQYSHSRRPGYDAARADALARGIDPNSAQFQMQYFADEYEGVHDPAPGKSLIGWTKVFEKAPANLTPEQAARYYTGSAQSGTGYFRPSTPHYDQRENAAKQIYGLYNKGVLTEAPQPVPQAPTTPVQPTTGQNIPFGQEAVLNGAPVRWGGNDYGWQSPGSFSTITPPAETGGNSFLGIPLPF